MHPRHGRAPAAVALAAFLIAPAATAKPDFVVDDDADNVFFDGCDVGTCTLREAFSAASAGLGRSIGCDEAVFPPGSATEVALQDSLTATVPTGFTLDCAGTSIVVTGNDVSIESGTGTPLSGVTLRGVSIAENLLLCAGSGGGGGCDQPLSKMKIEAIRAANLVMEGSSVQQAAVTRGTLEELRIFARTQDLSAVTLMDNHVGSELEVNSLTGTASKVKIVRNAVHTGDLYLHGQDGTRDVVVAENVVATKGLEVEGGTHSKISILKNQVNTTGDNAIGIELDALGDLVKIRIEDNSVGGSDTGSDDGIYVVSSGNLSKARIAKNRITGRDGEGIEVLPAGLASGVQILGNVTTANQGTGIYLDLSGAKKTKVQGNVANANGATGIDLDGGPFEVSKNRAFGNQDYGIDGWDAASSSFKKNEARNNPSADLSEQNGCASNVWKDNHFTHGDDPCIQ